MSLLKYQYEMDTKGPLQKQQTTPKVEQMVING